MGNLFRLSIPAVTLTSLAVLVTIRLHAQPLAEFERRAISDNPSIASTRLSAERARHLARAVSAWDPPGVGLEFNMLPPLEPDPTARGETMVMFEQMIPLGGQTAAMAGAMAAGERVERTAVDAESVALLAEIRSRYYTLWYIDRRIEIASRARRLLDLLGRVVELRYEIARAPQSELLALATESESLELEQSDMNRWRKEVEGELNARVGRSPDSAVLVPASPPAFPLPPLDSLRALVSGHPDLLRMEAMSRMSELEGDARLTMLRPMLMLRAGLAWMPQGHPLREAQVSEHGIEHGDGVMRWGLRLGAMISVPIAPWSRVGPEAESEALRIQAREEIGRRDDMRNRMEAMLRSSYLRAERALAAAEFTRHTSLPLLEQRLDAAREDYANGRVLFTALLDGYRTLVQADIDLAQRNLDYATSMVTIASITGALP